jgi:hypothetical protein
MAKRNFRQIKTEDGRDAVIEVDEEPAYQQPPYQPQSEYEGGD